LFHDKYLPPLKIVDYAVKRNIETNILKDIIESPAGIRLTVLKNETESRYLFLNSNWGIFKPPE
jgi:hypothetical protein